MAADKTRCVLCSFSVMRGFVTLAPKRKPTAWRQISSLPPWKTNTAQSNLNGLPLPWDCPSWLRSHHLQEYTEVLKNVRGFELVGLDDEALQRRGVSDAAARRRMLRELERLKGKGSETGSSTSITPDYTSLLHLTRTYTISPTTALSPATTRNRTDGWAITPLCAPTETSMAMPPVPTKGRGRPQRQRQPKRNSPLPFDQIPRTLTHHPQEKSPYGAGNRYRGVFINHLAPDTTHADVTAGIAATAPVGPITSVALLRPPPDKERAFGKLRAHVVFGRYQATAKLVQAARDGVLMVKGVGSSSSNSRTGGGGGDAAAAAVLQVTVDRSAAYHWNNGRRIDSRVLLVRGKPDTPGFTEREMREAMVADKESMEAAGPLGARSEPVVSYEVGEGCVTLEWRFFSHVQAMAMRGAVERAYGTRVAVYYGWDSCWVDEERGQVPERLNRAQAWRHDWG